MRSFTIPGLALPVSTIALGTGGFGSAIPADDAFRILDEFAAAGGTLLDTAHVYAAWLPNGGGASERTIGAWLKRSGLRDHVIIGTKGCHPPLDNMDESRLRPSDLQKDLKESLERLGVQTIDFYWLHRDDPKVPPDEILDALESERRSGRITTYGASNWSARRLEQSAAYAAKKKIPGFSASQIEWSLAASKAEPRFHSMLAMNDDALAFHRRTRLPVMAYSSQACGYFAKSLDALGGAADFDSPMNRERRIAAFTLAERLDVSPNAVALAWLTSQQFPVSAIIGPRTCEHLRESLTAADIVLSAPDALALTAASAHTST
jgi:aryl-alcohol dehydrogenase-like predicted oxidoreductase